MKKQVVIIHGGDTFENHEDYLRFLKDFEIRDLEYFRDGKNWKGNLSSALGDDYEVLAPQMPSKINAKYAEWKIWFDKLVPLLNPEVILVGHSLGGIFLIKYLSENNISNNIKSLHLVAAPYDAEGTNDAMADFIITNDLKNVEKQVSNIFFYQSMDDVVVPPLNVEKYRALLPGAKIHIFEDRGHFRQEEFPELLENIRNFS